MARPPAKPQRSSLTPFYIVLGVVAVLGIGVILFQLIGRGSPATQPIPVDVDPAELARTPGIAIGQPDAPAVIYEFSDFQCPACAQFNAFYGPLIKERLVDTGIARLVHYDFPLAGHPHAFLAARAGRCANEQDGFWRYQDLLYGRQPTWSALSDATAFFIDLAPEAGLDRAAFSSCLRSDRYQEEVSRSARLGETLNVRGTPTIFVNMKQLPGVPRSFDELERVVREEAGLATGGAAEPAPADAGR